MGDFFRRVAPTVSGARRGWLAAPATRGPRRRPGALEPRDCRADGREPATGTGKTAIALATPFLADTPPMRVLVLAPARQLRRQLVEQFSTYAQLTRIGVLPAGAGAPSVYEMSGRAGDWSEIEPYDVIAVPAAAVIETARACAAKGVRALVVLTAGFAESVRRACAPGRPARRLPGGRACAWSARTASGSPTSIT